MSDRREAIARVTADVIASDGLERASLRHIAARMGATIGTLTHQFRDRDDLLRTTFEVTVRSIRDRAARTARGKGGIALVRAILGEALPTSEERKVEAAVWLAFAMSATTNAEHAALYRGLYREWERGLTGVLADLVPEGGMDPTDACRVLMATADGIALSALAGRDLPAAEQRRLLAVAIDAVLRPVAP